MPTVSSNFAQFLANPKSPKFLKLQFDVFDDFLAENHNLPVKNEYKYIRKFNIFDINLLFYHYLGKTQHF